MGEVPHRDDDAQPDALQREWPTYPEYKDSGLHWLGNIPSHWNVAQFRRKMRKSNDGIRIGPFGSSLKREIMVDDGFKVFGQENVIYNDFTLGRNYIDEAKFEELGAYDVQPGDILITMMGTSGKCAIVPADAEVGIMDSHLLRVRVREDEIGSEFTRWLVNDSYYVREQIKALGKGAIMLGLNSTIVKSVVFGIPPLDEQHAIAAFLDRETAKLDALIAKKEQLIALLQEQRSAIISHAVTKGLDPDTPMKDSGVEWLGEIPSHWEVRRTGSLCRSIVPGRDKPTSFEGDIPWINIPDIRNLEFVGKSREGLGLSIENIKAAHTRIVPAYSVVMSCVGEFGIAAIAERDIVINQQLHAFVCSELLEPYFLRAVIQSQKTYMAMLASATTLAYLNKTKCESLYCPLPPKAEQIVIADHLAEIDGRLDTLVRETQKSIQLLEEYRTALISAAVTGKIDVRGVV